MTERGVKDNQYARETLENEGAGNAVLHYCDGDLFEDSKTRELWNEAEEALVALATHVGAEDGCY